MILVGILYVDYEDFFDVFHHAFFRRDLGLRTTALAMSFMRWIDWDFCLILCALAYHLTRHVYNSICNYIHHVLNC